MRKSRGFTDPFEKWRRGEITRADAYEISLEGIKDRLWERQLGAGTRVESLNERTALMNNPSSTLPDEYTTHDAEAVYHLRQLIAEIRIAMLTTIDGEGIMRSRPMITLRSEENGTLWFFSSDMHGKADELNADPRVNLTYAMTEKKQFLSVSGLAELVHDERRKRELWHPELSAWFPRGVEDRHLALIKVYVQKAEYWDVPSHRLIEMLSFTKAVLTGGTYHTAEPHQKIQFELGPM